MKTYQNSDWILMNFQELYNKCTRPQVRSIMLSIVSKLEIILWITKCKVNETSKMEKKQSDIVADRNTYGTETELTSIQNVQTVIISRTSSVTNIDRRNGTKPSKITTALTSKCEKNYGNQDRRCKIIIIGDSHMKGYASELSRNPNKLYKITGYVKPNSDVSVLINIAKRAVSKLAKNGILFFFGGEVGHGVLLMMLIKMYLGRPNSDCEFLRKKSAYKYYCDQHPTQILSE
jgi:hypothetical protein